MTHSTLLVSLLALAHGQQNAVLLRGSRERVAQMMALIASLDVAVPASGRGR